MLFARGVGSIRNLRVEGEAADVTEKFRVPMRTLWLVRACTTVEEVGAQHAARDERKNARETTETSGRDKDTTRTSR